MPLPTMDDPNNMWSQRSTVTHRNMVQKHTRDSITYLQRKIAILAVILMGINGAVIVLAILHRRVLRLVQPEWFIQILFSSNLSIISGLLQIVHAGFCCFVAIWELKTPIQASVYSSALMMIVDLASFTNASRLFVLCSFDKTPTTEHIYRAWYIWECLGPGSCEAAYREYAFKYLVPLALITLLSLGLQCGILVQLHRFYTILKARQIRIWKGMQDLRSNLEETHLQPR